MMSFLLKRWFLLLMLTGIAVALFFPFTTGRALDLVGTRPIIPILLTLMSIGLESSKLWNQLRRPWASLFAIAITFGLAPPLCYLVGHSLLSKEYMIGLIIVGCLPCTLASATIWTRLAGGNEAVSLMVTMFTNSLVFLFTAAWLSFLTGQQVSFDPMSMLADLFKIVAVPILIGQILRRSDVVAKQVSRHKKAISVWCRLLILVVIIKAAAGAEIKLREQGRSLFTDPQLVAVLAVCVGTHLLLLVVGYCVGKRLFGIEDAVAIAFAGSQKTLPVGIFLIDAYYGLTPLAIVPLLFFHIGQLVLDTYVAERFFYAHTHPKLAAPPEASTT